MTNVDPTKRRSSILHIGNHASLRNARTINIHTVLPAAPFYFELFAKAQYFIAGKLLMSSSYNKNKIPWVVLKVFLLAVNTKVVPPSIKHLHESHQLMPIFTTDVGTPIEDHLDELVERGLFAVIPLDDVCSLCTLTRIWFHMMETYDYFDT